MLVSFGWLKVLYPYPNFIPPDSYNYLEAAVRNDFISIWPIGYSRFLRLVSCISSSHFVLVMVQYLLLMSVVLYFLFTIRYLLSPGKWLFRILLIISIGNPLLPHISNFVSSDSLFATLSLVWFTQLLWIQSQPNLKLLLWHAVVLLLAFTVRYTAVWYPLLSITIIIFTSMSPKSKKISIAAIAVLLLLLIARTQYEYKIKTDTAQYAAFGGWQLAANALYAYAYAKPMDTINGVQQFGLLHKIVNQHFDSLRRIGKNPKIEIGVYYMWDFSSPLRTFMNEKWLTNKATPFFTQWASVGPLYRKYGWYLINNYPRLFIKHYCWPNLVRFYAPPAYFMEKYNLGNTNVEPIAATWFDWKSNVLPIPATGININIISIFPNLLAIINPLFLISSLLFSTAGGFSQCSCKKLIACLLLFWFGNLIFSVFSAPIELRYQIFPVIVTIPFLGMFLTASMQTLLTRSAIEVNEPISKAKIST
ncbi:hypothetical protein A4H97_22940 [Niastella yeongjuensis]|uniref:Glycosyltransferase RgtA/B/C/D-like domain-containing protein n=2 Tax=Niastella yeongjuensis TaxID=354355 RepID=A0A1V9F7U4_9BACT|nr:hypothetical protein A4H97_22940 [Niastella yeongjuensis]